MTWLNHIIIFKCLQLLLDKYKWMFAWLWTTKGIIWYLHPNSLTLLRYYWRKHQSVSVEFKWHKWAFLIPNEILLSDPPRWSSPIFLRSSPFVEISGYNAKNKHGKYLEDRSNNDVLLPFHIYQSWRWGIWIRKSVYWYLFLKYVI